MYFNLKIGHTYVRMYMLQITNLYCNDIMQLRKPLAVHFPMLLHAHKPIRKSLTFGINNKQRMTVMAKKIPPAITP